MGRQAQLVLCNVLGFWIIGTLTGWSLAFPAHLGVSGLWIGIIAGVCSCGRPCKTPGSIAQDQWEGREIQSVIRLMQQCFPEEAVLRTCSCHHAYLSQSNAEYLA